MKIEPRCYKLNLPNGKVVDILAELIVEISRWMQFGCDLPESGGYILGYQHRISGNITLEFITTPQEQDIRSRIRCIIKDVFHGKALRSARLQKSFYMGVWHTHPEVFPLPSLIDINDWNQSLNCEITASDFIFFIIVGTEDFRVWIGDYHNHTIIEVYETERNGDLYVKKQASL